MELRRVAMTENEAIEKLYSYLECESRRAKIVSCNESCDDCELWYMQGTVSEHIESVEKATKSLEEVQQYRAIGTVEECRKSVEICKSMIGRNITPENMEEYMKFEDECISEGFTFNSLLEAREK